MKIEHKKIEKPLNNDLKKKVVRLLFKTAFFILIIYILLFRLFGFVKLESDSMEPKMMGGDLALIYRINTGYQAGDVVLYEKDGKDYIGRIIAVEHDVVDLNDDVFMINGGSDSTVYYEKNKFPKTQSISYPYTLSDKQLFIVGDNRNNIDDSRSFGGIFESQVKGKIIGIFRSHAL